MTETQKFVSANKDCLIPQPFVPNFYPELPYYLRKDVLKKIRYEEDYVPGSLWNQRGEFIETRIQNLISKLPNIDNVKRNGKNTQEDYLGRDIAFEHQGKTMYIQVKSSRWGLTEFKKAIRNKIKFHNKDGQLVGPWAKEALVSETLTERGIILVNGSETKSDDEILNESFYPQLNRIIWYRNKLSESQITQMPSTTNQDEQLNFQLAV